MTPDALIDRLRDKGLVLLLDAAGQMTRKDGSWSYANGCVQQVEIIDKLIDRLASVATERLRSAAPALLAACEAAHADLKREIESLEAALYRHEPDATGAMIPVPGTAGDEGETELNGMRALLAQLADAITQAKGTAP